MAGIRKVMWLLVIPCHVFSRTSSPSGNCTGLSEITFEELLLAVSQSKQVSALSMRIADLEKKLGDLQKYVPRVIFSAYVSDRRDPEVQKPILYDQVTVNQGQGYDPATGTFSAPVTGIYQFTYSLLGKTDSLDTAIHLVVNQERVNYIHSVLKADQAQTASVTVILSLNVGDRVWVTLEQGGVWTEQRAISFQGLLLSAV
ncbi:complement C1q tumor necrosis factor-related protein 3-like [Hemiscyllium ocellatum]|uniref:complement C1q tumor necrosis factor-related protein 3-like n=1 Tax=Hemiscyllium ocellatum TaxID=170820 RepID=UPI002965FCFA|nr:complement C1q tumor necrosis factor-related protein 3-like [Hemiscyllium ocellatum]XP_060679427.1 complement C1q tumor necrosis factor-related protein 3-like [Hemiscyllium ocellatum]